MIMRLVAVVHFIIFVLNFITVHGNGAEHGVIVPGGISSDEYPAGDNIIQLIRELSPKIRNNLQGLAGGRYILMESVTPISYRTQLVNGVNYFVKVGARTSRKAVYYHLRIFKPFEGPAQLIKVTGPKRYDDAISYF